MKKFALLMVFFSVSPLIAMDNLSEKDVAELNDRVRQIEFARGAAGSSFFSGREKDRSFFIDDQVRIIVRILSANSIPHPQNKTVNWLQNLQKELALKKAKPQEKAPEENKEELDDTTCSIAGLDKVDVLKALFESARAGGVLPSARKCPADDRLHAMLEADSYVDYLGGKPLKVNLQGDSFDAYLYDRDNGEGAAQRAIGKLRKRLQDQQ